MPGRGSLLRWALAVSGRRVSPWDAHCIRQLLSIEGAHLALCLVPAGEPRHLWRRRIPFRHSLWRLLDRHVRARLVRAHTPMDLERALGGRQVREVEVRYRDDGTPELPDGEVADLAALNVHFLLDLGFGGIRGRAVPACHRGVWTFTYGEGGTASVAPIGFDEIAARGEVVRAALVRLAETPPGDRVLHRGCFKLVRDSLSQTAEAVLGGVSSWPARECRRLVAGVEGPVAPEPLRGDAERRQGRPHAVGRAGPSRGEPPSNFEVLRLLGRLARNYVAGVWRELFRHELWALGLVRRPVEELLDVRRVHIEWLPARRANGYLADPFGVAVNGSLHVLAEEFDYRSRRGSIAAISFRAEGGTVERFVQDALRLPTHASYPFLLEHEGELYCVPETSAEREVRLYRARSFPDDWEQTAVLVRDFAAADATVFQHQGLWWLFCIAADGDARTHLHAWWSTELTGSWGPHLLNPLKSDVRSSRPAGPVFRRGTSLYRPAQDCSRTYGEAVTINRIDELTPTSFGEQWVHTLRPDPTGPFPHGLHTLTGVGDVTLVDGKRWVLVPSELRRAALARLFRLVSRPLRPRAAPDSSATPAAPSLPVGSAPPR